MINSIVLTTLPNNWFGPVKGDGTQRIKFVTKLSALPSWMSVIAEKVDYAKSTPYSLLSTSFHPDLGNTTASFVAIGSSRIKFGQAYCPECTLINKIVTLSFLAQDTYLANNINYYFIS